MSTEYTFKTRASTPASGVVARFAHSLAAEEVSNGFARRDGLHIMGIDHSAADVVNTVGRSDLLGPGDVASVTFRFLDHQMADAYSQASFRDMVECVVSFLTAEASAVGLLLFNGETIMLQRLPGGEITFDDEWNQYAPDPDDPGLPAISAGYPGFRLPQPLL